MVFLIGLRDEGPVGMLVPALASRPIAMPHEEIVIAPDQHGKPIFRTYLQNGTREIHP